MANQVRRRANNDRRMWSCVCCGYPITQRHHMLPVSIYGETQNTRELCANCHEAFHVFERAYKDILAGQQTSRNIILMMKLRDYWKSEHRHRIKTVCGYVQDAYALQHQLATVSGDRIWSDFFDAYDQRRKEGR